MPSQNGPPERTGADESTEKRILDAARQVFVRRGTAGTRMQEIAEEAGVNQALLHYYFRSKERLAATVFQEAASRLIPAVARILGTTGSLEEKIEAFVHIYIDTVRQTPFLPAYVLAELHQHPARMLSLMQVAGVKPGEAAGELRQRLGEQLRERAAAGAIRVITPEHFLVTVLGLVVFPFLARPVLQTAFGMDEDDFARFLDERRAALPGVILNALKP